MERARETRETRRTLEESSFQPTPDDRAPTIRDDNQSCGEEVGTKSFFGSSCLLYRKSGDIIEKELYPERDLLFCLEKKIPTW